MPDPVPDSATSPTSTNTTTTTSSSAPANGDHPRSRSPSSATQSPPAPNNTSHHLTYSGMPMHMYPFPPGLVQPQPARTKRRQVKNACTNCQKACKKCDDARPCLRCVKYGIAEECVDSQRKERQKGIKRGPYKKRDGKDRASGNVEQQLDLSVQSGLIPAAIAATSATPPMPYMTPVGYPAGFFGMPAAPPKPGEAPTAYTYPATQYYLAPFPMPAPPQPGQEGEAPAYPAGFYPAITFAPYAAPPYAAQYMVPAPLPPRGDGQQQQQQQQMPQPMPIPMGQMPMAQMSMAQLQGMAPIQGMAPMPQALQYAAYPQAYQKPPSRGPGSEMSTPAQMMEPTARRDVRLEYNGRMGEGLSGGHGKSG